MISGVCQRPHGVLTYSTAIRSASDSVVLKLELVVEDIGVELSLAVEALTDALPARGRFRHGVCCRRAWRIYM